MNEDAGRVPGVAAELIFSLALVGTSSIIHGTEVFIFDGY
jgi:hypothetical protein